MLHLPAQLKTLTLAIHLEEPKTPIRTTLGGSSSSYSSPYYHNKNLLQGTEVTWIFTT